MLQNLKEDIKQYNLALEDFENIDSSDFMTAYELAKEFLLLANRWNEIMLESAKYCTLVDTSKSSFEKWAYHKYRILMTAHEFCRVTYRQGKEEYSNNFNSEL